MWNSRHWLWAKYHFDNSIVMHDLQERAQEGVKQSYFCLYLLCQHGEELRKKMGRSCPFSLMYLLYFQFPHLKPKMKSALVYVMVITPYTFFTVTLIVIRGKFTIISLTLTLPSSHDKLSIIFFVLKRIAKNGRQGLKWKLYLKFNNQVGIISIEMSH